MPVEVQSELDGKLLEMHVTGKLLVHDYEQFLPAVEQAILKHHKVRMLIDMHDFHGWAAGAAWEDLKFAVRHFTHIERIAMVGETKWEQWMTTFAKPFTAATIRYFPREKTEEARTWVQAA